MYVPHRTEGNNNDDIIKIRNRRGLYILATTANFRVSIITNDDWIHLFECLQIEHGCDYQNYNVSNIRPHVKHIAKEIAHLFHKVGPTGYLNPDCLRVLGGWCKAMMIQPIPYYTDIEKLIKSAFGSKPLSCCSLQIRLKSYKARIF